LVSRRSTQRHRNSGCRRTRDDGPIAMSIAAQQADDPDAQLLVSDRGAFAIR
jgi:hypothetical protein